jgi:hypothetical protein
VKVVPQASNCRELTVGGRTYRRRANGLFDLPEAAAKHVVKFEGGQQPSLSGTTRKATGFRCVDCGFGTFVKTCSRCGAECEREVA